ncbi:PREDICTED: reverse mRNAase [Prunus dulcis]|uniref:PREDICTED: reverse mRNAase n=1 Tax=Prunus dulcis TaxID=3755 RepID=A0A5E4FJ63_PRUDU|nr:PREDICTED: reverse mRNAase [Prunus dulcis]
MGNGRGEITMKEDGLGSDHVLRLFKKRRFSTEDEGHTTTAPMGKRPGHIDAIFGGLEPTAFRFTSFYGNPYMRIHKHLWDLLQRIAGDMRDCGAALKDCGMSTVGFRGYKFTWSNRWRGSGNVQLCLDRMVANDLMFLAFSDMLTHHLNSMVLDHLPILKECGSHSWAWRNRRFMFEELWTTFEGC